MLPDGEAGGEPGHVLDIDEIAAVVAASKPAKTGARRF